MNAYSAADFAASQMRRITNDVEDHFVAQVICSLPTHRRDACAESLRDGSTSDPATKLLRNATRDAVSRVISGQWGSNELEASAVVTARAVLALMSNQSNVIVFPAKGGVAS